MSRLAFVGLDRHIYLTDTSGAPEVGLTAPLPGSGGTWGARARPQEVWSWPTWSPDGEWIAAFSLEGGDDETGPVRVVALSIDGVRQIEWARVPNVSPIYLQWHPSGAAISALFQQDQELALALLAKDRLGQVRTIEQGVPLFFNWTPRGDRLLIHVGSREDPKGRLILRDPMGDGEDALFDDAPGSFCAPIFKGSRAIVALHGDEGSSVVCCRADGSDAKTLFQRKGLLAMLPAPGEDPWVAVGCAPRGEGTPYQGIELVHVETGESRAITTSECLAFFWAPTGDYLLFAVVDAEANCLHWRKVGRDGGDPVELGTFWPTRDILFYLHFFDQYAQSHNIISPDGRYVAFAGYPAGGGRADLSNPPNIWLTDVQNPTCAPQLVGHGSFAVFSPT